MEQNQVSIQPQEQQSSHVTNRKNKYLSYIEKFPYYSTLMVLDDYEKQEIYEECAVIRDAITDYMEKYKDKLPNIKFPRHLSEYEGVEHQSLLESKNIIVENKFARDKARLIKIQLPLR